jgi:hypothetical protein
MGSPDAINSEFMTEMSSMVIPSIGNVATADPPPEIRKTITSEGRVA